MIQPPSDQAAPALLDTNVAHVVVCIQAGSFTERYVTDEQASGLRVASNTDGMPPFDASPVEFRLAAEAARIRYPALDRARYLVPSFISQQLNDAARSTNEDWAKAGVPR